MAKCEDAEEATGHQTDRLRGLSHGSGSRRCWLAAGVATPLVLGDVRFALLWGHRVEQNVRARDIDALALVQGPHLLRIEIQMRLRDQRLAVVADVAQILERLGEILAVDGCLPLAHAGEPAHRRSGAALVLHPERYC